MNEENKVEICGISINIDEIIAKYQSLSEEEKATKNKMYEERDKERAIKEAALLDRMKSACIYSFIYYLKDIKFIKNFYDIEKRIPLFEEHLSEVLLLSKNEKYDVYVAIAVKEYNENNINSIVTEKELHFIKNPNLIKLDKKKLSNKALKYFFKYWDDILDSYKIKSARIKRIQYLINYIDQIKDKEYITNYPNIRVCLLEKQVYYQNLLHLDSISVVF